MSPLRNSIPSHHAPSQGTHPNSCISSKKPPPISSRILPGNTSHLITSPSQGTPPSHHTPSQKPHTISSHTLSETLPHLIRSHHASSQKHVPTLPRLLLETHPNIIPSHETSSKKQHPISCVSSKKPDTISSRPYTLISHTRHDRTQHSQLTEPYTTKHIRLCEPPHTTQYTHLAHSTRHTRSIFMNKTHNRSLSSCGNCTRNTHPHLSP